MHLGPRLLASSTRVERTGALPIARSVPISKMSHWLTLVQHCGAGGIACIKDEDKHETIRKWPPGFGHILARLSGLWKRWLSEPPPPSSIFQLCTCTSQSTDDGLEKRYLPQRITNCNGHRRGVLAMVRRIVSTCSRRIPIHLQTS
jgi:hypothetical protein